MRETAPAPWRRGPIAADVAKQGIGQRASAKAMNEEQKRNMRWLAVFLAAAIVWPDAVLAADTLGDVICNVRNSGTAYPPLVNAIAYIAGGFLIVRGFLLLKRHAENPNQSVVAGIAHCVGGGLLLALPAVVRVLQYTVLSSVASNQGGCLPGTVGAASALDVIMQNLVNNIYGPMFSLVSVIGLLVGITFVIKGLLAGVKTGTDPRAASPKSIINNLVIGAILISLSTIAPDILKTLFGSGTMEKMSDFSSVINWSGIVGSANTAADKTVQAILGFIQIIGGIAFLRGWLIVKAAVEGGGQATIPQGLTHIIGGAMAVNIYTMLKIFNATFGVNIIK